jgi:enoyl-CoA hydratase
MLGRRIVGAAMPVLRVEKDAAVATVTLNRPEALNALSRELRGAIAEAFGRLQQDGETRVVVLTGAGRAFCAGVDLKELASASRTADGFSGAEMLRAITAFEGPIIGAINGFAITGGFELALACDLLIASSEARFADTHARVGILPGWGLSQKLPRLIGIQRAKELSLTGNFIDAEQAEAWGLVNRVVAPAELLPSCRALAADMLSCEPDSLRAYKRLIDAGYAVDLGEGLEIEARASREHLRGVSPEAIAERRRGIQRRGRAQAGD